MLEICEVQVYGITFSLRYIVCYKKTTEKKPSISFFMFKHNFFKYRENAALINLEFNVGCDLPYYGEDCSKICGLCKSGVCDIDNGQCDSSGCIHQEFQAPACNGTIFNYLKLH